METTKTLGTVKWFNASKGYGFIVTEDDKEVFAHYSEIKSKGYRNLVEGDKVEFTVVNGDKGLKATDIVKV